MDKIPPNLYKVDSEDVGSMNEPKVVETSKGRSVHSRNVDVKSSKSADNQLLDKKITDRRVVSEQLQHQMKDSRLINTVSEQEVFNSKFIELSHGAINLRNTIWEKSNQSEFNETSVLADMFFSKEMSNEFSEIQKKKTAPDLTRKEKIIFARKSDKIKFNEKCFFPSTIGDILLRQLESKGQSLENVSDKMFREELSVLLKDFKQRGIGISKKMHELELRSDKNIASGREMIEKSFSRINAYYKEYASLKEFDSMLEEYINSDSCPKWDSDIPIYRGGEAVLERKNFRNKEKEKPMFRRDLINRGGVAYGFGQYYTDKVDYAQLYAEDKLNPVLLKVHLKKDIPVVNSWELQRYFKKEEMDIKWNLYLEKIQSKYPLVLPYMTQYVDNQTGEIKNAGVFTLPDPSVIDKMDLQAIGNVVGHGLKSVGQLSMQRLDEKRCIVGNPKAFKEVAIPESQTIKKTEFKAYGYKEGYDLPVLECYIDGVMQHVVESPEQGGVYWLVKQMPESMKKEQPEFIIEPSSDFFVNHKKEKLSALQTVEAQSELDKKAEESRKAIRSFFDEACIERLEELTFLED